MVSGARKYSANEALAFILASDSERNDSLVMNQASNLQIVMVQKKSHVSMAWKLMKDKKMSSRYV